MPLHGNFLCYHIQVESLVTYRWYACLNFMGILITILNMMSISNTYQDGHINEEKLRLSALRRLGLQLCVGSNIGSAAAILYTKNTCANYVDCTCQ